MEPSTIQRHQIQADTSRVFITRARFLGMSSSILRLETLLQLSHITLYRSQELRTSLQSSSKPTSLHLLLSKHTTHHLSRLTTLPLQLRTTTLTTTIPQETQLLQRLTSLNLSSRIRAPISPHLLSSNAISHQ